MIEDDPKRNLSNTNDVSFLRNGKRLKVVETWCFPTGRWLCGTIISRYIGTKKCSNVWRTYHTDWKHKRDVTVARSKRYSVEARACVNRRECLVFKSTVYTY